MPHTTPLIAATDFRTCISGTLHRATRVVDAVYRRHLAPHGITVSQLIVLSTVGQFGEIEQAELGRVLALERSSVTRELKRLTERGWIVRLAGEARSRYRLELTREGADLLNAVVPDWQAAMAECEDALGPAGIDAVGRLQIGT